MKAALPILAAAGALAAGLAAPATAQGGVSRVIVYGSDPCPRGSGGEDIVVCARKPETERYRIPQELRNAPSDDPASQSWANRAESLEYVGQTGIQSCSTVGPGGFTGCWAEMVRAARGERAKGSAEPGR